MNSATPALLALLLVFSLVAIPVAAGPGDGLHTQSTAELQDHTTSDSAAGELPNRLSLQGETRAEYAEYGPNFGTQLMSMDDELRSDYTQYTIIDSEFEDASRDEREMMVRANKNWITDRITALEKREEEAVQAHASSEISTSELLQTFVRNHNEAQVLYDALEDLEDRTDRIPGYELSVNKDQRGLSIYDTEIRQHLDEVMRGEKTSNAILSVETSEDGYVLSYLGHTYTREATRFDHRESETGNEFDDLVDVQNYVEEQYPRYGKPGQMQTAQPNLYIVSASGDQSDIKMHLDDGTGAVYREEQKFYSLDSIPVANETVWATDDLQLSLNETPADGPVKVTVTDADSGEPVSATIRIGGVKIGETNADGTFWYIPVSDEYEITAETEADQISVSVPVEQ